MNNKYPIIIPVSEPDEHLISVITDLIKSDQKYIVIVDDGCGDESYALFARAQKLIAPEGIVISCGEKIGKGGALKTAFRHVLKNMPELKGVVTADVGCLHTVDCIECVLKKLIDQPNSMVLGVRYFGMEGIAKKSSLGEKLARRVFKYVSGISVSDMLTGLRGIPACFLPECLTIKENGFEFGVEMLLRTSGKIGIVETPTEIIRSPNSEFESDFNHFLDSVKVYKVLCRRFFIFIFSSFSSSIIDLTLFTLFCILLKQRFPESYIISSTVFARIISACFNYIVNYTKVFHSRAKVTTSGAKYALLAILQMSCSAMMVNCGKFLLPFIQETLIKIVVDIFLFFVSYKIQQKFVYPMNSKNSDISK